jgi:hypothetical protein
MRRTLLCLIALFGSACGGIEPPALGAQPSSWGAQEILRQFETDISTNAGAAVGVSRLLQVLHQPESSSAKIDSLLAGLERLALQSPNPNVRQSAAGYLLAAGSPTEVPRPFTQATERLARVFENSADQVVRHSIIENMPRQANVDRAIRFLRAVATKPDPAPQRYFDQPDEPTQAIEALLRLGERGRSALREIHSNRNAGSARARAQLDLLASRNYSLTPSDPSRRF